MKSKKTIIILIASILVVGIALTVTLLLKKDNKKPNNNKNKEKEELKFPEEKKKLQIIDEDSNSRPYAVMINNINVARKAQSGLSDAYIVYELIVEGGITRYLALFKDAQTSRIGSVRSARHYYLDYVLENDAIYVHWGWSPQAQEDIRSLDIDNINGLSHDKYFFRSNPFKISSEHTGFTKMESLRAGAEKLKYKTTSEQENLLSYSIEPVNYENTVSAKKVDIKYSKAITNNYMYNEETKTYLRSVNGKEQIDYNTSKQLEVKNIIFYEVESYTIAGDEKGRQFLKNIGSGTGYYISEGAAVKINWSKKDRKSQTIYTLENGDELKVNDGNTFIQIVPTTGNIVME